MIVECDAALGRMSVACGPASILLPAADSPIQTTTEELASTTITSDAHHSPVNVTALNENDGEFLHPDHFGKIATVNQCRRRLRVDIITPK